MRILIEINSATNLLYINLISGNIIDIMVEKKILQTIYTSAASTKFSPIELKKLLQKAREFNHSLGVSGMLVYDDDCFIQVLEGEELAVNEIYDKISKDKRHTNIRLLYRGIEQNKEFEDWSMGFVDATGLTIDTDGVIPYDSIKIEVLEKTRAKKLLKMFQEGAWRQKISY